MRELTAREVEFVGGGDFWGGLKEDIGQLGQEIENIWQGFLGGGSSSGTLPVIPPLQSLEQACVQAGGTFTYGSGTLTIGGLGELGAGQITFTGYTVTCSPN